MLKITTARVVVWAVLAVLTYIGLVHFVPKPLLIDALNGMFLGVVAAVAVVYAPLVWSTLCNNKFDRASQLSIGIGLLWFSIAMSRAWAAYYRYMGSPQNLLNHPIVGFVVYTAFIGGCFFVTAPGYYPPTPIPFGGRNRKLLIAFALIGATLAVVFHYSGGNRTLVHFGERN